MVSQDYLDKYLDNSKGNVGLFQKKLLFFLTIAAITNYEPITINFSAYEMDFICEVPELSNYTFAQQKEILGSQKCYKPDRDFTGFNNITNNSKQVAPMVKCGEPYIFDTSVFIDSQSRKVCFVFTSLLLHVFSILLSYHIIYIHCA